MPKLKWEPYKSPEDIPENLIGKTLLFRVSKDEGVGQLVTGTFHNAGRSPNQFLMGIIGGRFHYDWNHIIAYADLEPVL